MELWSAQTFLLSTAAAFLVANVTALLIRRRADRTVTRFLAELGEHPGALYPAALFTHGYGRHDSAVTGWAAVHRARRPLPDGESDHPITALARGVVERDGGVEDITEVTGQEGFFHEHWKEATWLTDRLPRSGDDIIDLRAELMAYPAAAVSGWMAFSVFAYLTASLKAEGAGLDVVDADDPAAAYGGAILIGLLLWLVGFLVMLAVQAALWSPAYGRWLQRVRDRGAHVLRRELGEAYDDFLADLRQSKSAALRPPIPPRRGTGLRA
ncbi:hypothetical protein [Streptomyces sp. NPDC005890]|uniref:hypothetical protein n=1 Tax=Streptomyces sp. NPDC005890 TaxID=3154568 RepID=UPI0033DF2035